MSTENEVSDETILAAARAAREARDESIVAERADREGSTDRATSLRLFDDAIAAASRMRVLERKHRELVALKRPEGSE